MKCQENWWVCLKDRGRVTDHIISYAILWGKVNSLEKASSCLQIWLRIQLVVLLVTRIGFCKYTDKSSKMHKGFLYVQSFVVFYCVAVPEEVGTCCHLQLWMVHPMSKSFHGRNLLLVLIDTIDCWAYLIFLVTLVEELIFLLMLGSFHTPGPAMHYDVGAGRLWSSLNASITPLPHLLGVNMKKMLID